MAGAQVCLIVNLRVCLLCLVIVSCVLSANQRQRQVSINNSYSGLMFSTLKRLGYLCQMSTLASERL